jgi:hypothetical protein
MSKLQITFKGPGRCFNPLDFLNGFTQIPSKPGVYIWGYLVSIDGKEVFCPVNVGETGPDKGLRNRLIEHYSNRHNYNAAFFGFESIMGLETVKEVYKEMGVYRYIGKNTRSTKKYPDGKLSELIRHNSSTPFKHFLYFQDFNFFCDIRKAHMGIRCIDPSVVEVIRPEPDKSKKLDIPIGDLVKELSKSPSTYDIAYLNRLKARFDVHQNKFYAIWWEQEDINNDHVSINNRVDQVSEEATTTPREILNTFNDIIEWNSRLYHKIEKKCKTLTDINTVKNIIKHELLKKCDEKQRLKIENTINIALADELGIFTIADYNESNVYENYEITFDASIRDILVQTGHTAKSLNKYFCNGIGKPFTITNIMWAKQKRNISFILLQKYYSSNRNKKFKKRTHL